MGVGKGSPCPFPWILKFSVKKRVVFLVSCGKKFISPVLASLEKLLKNPPVAPSGKNSLTISRLDQLKLPGAVTTGQYA